MPSKDLVIKDVHERLAQRGGAYGLVRHDGFLMHFPGQDFMLANVTHLETPLDPLQTAPHGGRRARSGRQRHPVSQGRVSDDFRERAHPHVRQSRPPADALDRRPPSAHARRHPEGRSARRRGRPLRLVGRAAQREGSRPLGAVRAGPRLLHPARLHDPAGRRQHRHGRTMCRRRTSRRCRRSA